MSQNDDQNRDRQNQGEGFEDPGSDESRQSRTGSTEDSPSQDQESSPRPDQSSDLEDTDEMDEDDDRDDDLRIGGSNRRRSIN